MPSSQLGLHGDLNFMTFSLRLRRRALKLIVDIDSLRAGRSPLLKKQALREQSSNQRAG